MFFLKKKKCNICLEKKRIISSIKCCKGKKWCYSCKNNVKSLYTRCPFCRSKFPIEYKVEYKMSRYPGQRFFSLVYE